MKFSRDYKVSLARRDAQYQDPVDHLSEVMQEIIITVDSFLGEQLGTVEKDVVVRVTVEITGGKG